MRRRAGYALSVVTGYLVARHLHALDVRWTWYSDGPGNGDDALALAVFLAVTAVGCWITYQVTPTRRKVK